MRRCRACASALAVTKPSTALRRSGLATAFDLIPSCELRCEHRSLRPKSIADETSMRLHPACARAWPADHSPRLHPMRDALRAVFRRAGVASKAARKKSWVMPALPSVDHKIACFPAPNMGGFACRRHDSSANYRNSNSLDPKVKPPHAQAESSLPESSLMRGCRLLTIEIVIELTSMGRTSIYQFINDGTFPRPVKVGKSSRWVESEVEQWIQQLRRARH